MEPKILHIGDRRFMTNLGGACLIVSWNAVWKNDKYVRRGEGNPPHRRSSTMMWLPNPERLVLPPDPLDILQMPGAEPLLCIAVRILDTTYSRKASRVFKTSAEIAVSRMNGEAWLLKFGDTTWLAHNSDAIDLSEYAKFELSALVGDDMQKLLSTAKTKLRKLLK